MRKDDISRLLQRYLASRKEGKEPYFDADEIDELLNSFDESDDYTYYDEVLALGLKLHPGNVDLQIRQCRQYVYNQDYNSALALIEEIAETDISPCSVYLIALSITLPIASPVHFGSK